MSCKSQITAKLKALIETIQETNSRNAPEYQNKRESLTQEIASLTTEIENKQTEADNIQVYSTSSEDSDLEVIDNEEKNVMEVEILKLRAKKQDLKEQLSKLEFAPRLAELKNQ